MGGRSPTITCLDSRSVRYLGLGCVPLFTKAPSQLEGFKEYPWSWGGQEMWKDLENKGQYLQWLVLGLSNSTSVCVTVGSYNQKTAPNISGAGIFLCCTKAQSMFCANFYKELTPPASIKENCLIWSPSTLFYWFCGVSTQLRPCHP